MAGEIVLTVFLLIVGLILIIKGGDWFVDSASKIAEISGVPQFIIGATIVSLGTTLPELLTSAIAAGKGQADMAIGNAVGSVNANIGIIMAISLLFMPHVIERKAYMFKGLTMVISIVVLFLLCLKGSLNAWLSIILLVIFAAFLIENILVGKKQSQANKLIDNGLSPATADSPSEAVTDEAKIVEETEPKELNKKGKPKMSEEQIRTIVKSVIMFIVGAACIVGGATLLVDNGTKLAKFMGISERIIAVTIVAIGTSLPELVTTITAIVKKKHDLSVGNIIGANVIDLCLILPLCAMIQRGTLPVSASMLYIDMTFCIGFAAIAVLPALIAKKFSRWQGMTLLAVYVAYLVLSLVPLGL